VAKVTTVEEQKPQKRRSTYLQDINCGEYYVIVNCEQ